MLSLFSFSLISIRPLFNRHFSFFDTDRLRAARDADILSFSFALIQLFVEFSEIGFH